MTTYTDSQTTQLRQLYASGVAVDVIAAMLAYTPRSVISKLTSLGIYQKAPVPQARPKKTQLVAEIAQHLELSPVQLESLNAATYAALSLLCSTICSTVQRG